jgi:hypothetical protein
MSEVFFKWKAIEAIMDLNFCQNSPEEEKRSKSKDTPAPAAGRSQKAVIDFNLLNVPVKWSLVGYKGPKLQLRRINHKRMCHTITQQSRSTSAVSTIVVVDVAT